MMAAKHRIVSRDRHFYLQRRRWPFGWRDVKSDKPSFVGQQFELAFTQPVVRYETIAEVTEDLVARQLYMPPLTALDAQLRVVAGEVFSFTK